MSRTLRPHLPGAAFHITTRTQAHHDWFTDRIRDRVEEIVIAGFAASDAQLIAGTIMPNHLHIVLRQGTRPLGWTMQPILRRVALLVQKSVGVQGHVFERPFRAKTCDTPDYLRNAIVYTNLNPHRAGLCDHGHPYPHCSHNQFSRGVERFGFKSVAEVLQLYCDNPTTVMRERCESYRRYAAWRLAKDEADLAGILFNVPQPQARFGDRYYYEHFTPWQLGAQAPLRDLRDKARDLLRDIAPMFEVAELKGRFISRSACHARRQLIAALLQSGYRCKSVASFLQISDTTVSAVASALRYSVLGLNGIPEGGPQ